jgi:uncharacterized spore protein YtfJ
MMDHIKNLLAAVSKRFEKLARANAVIAKPISVGDRHVVPLCELSLAFGAGGGTGEVIDKKTKSSSGAGGGAGGGAKASPVAVLVIEGGKARIEKIGE